MAKAQLKQKEPLEYLEATRSVGDFVSVIEQTEFPETVNVAIPVFGDASPFVVDQFTPPISPETHIVREFILGDFDGDTDEEMVIRQLHRHNFTQSMIGEAIGMSRAAALRRTHKYGLVGISGNRFHNIVQERGQFAEAVRHMSDKEARTYLIDYLDFLFDKRNPELLNLRAKFKLTSKEGMILAHLVRNIGKCCSKDSILGAVYGDQPEIDWPELKIIDVFVCKIRKKMEANGAAFTIDTVWGEGYRVEEPKLLAAPDPDQGDE